MSQKMYLKGSRVSNIVNDEIHKLRTKDGLIRPSDVVESARSDKSPLHKYFTWDNSEASERYRIIEAERLIRACVVLVDSNGSKIPFRAFVSMRDDRILDGGYRSIVEVLGDDELHAKLLEDALFELQMFQKKYEKLQELSPIFSIIEELQNDKSI